MRVLARALGRATLLALLALLGWGTLLLLVTLANAITRGPGEALGLLVPSPGATPWAWVGASSAALALVSWAGVAVLLVVSRRPPHGASAAPEAATGSASGAALPPDADPNAPPD